MIYLLQSATLKRFESVVVS